MVPLRDCTKHISLGGRPAGLAVSEGPQGHFHCVFTMRAALRHSFCIRRRSFSLRGGFFCFDIWLLDCAFLLCAPQCVYIRYFYAASAFMFFISIRCSIFYYKLKHFHIKLRLCLKRMSGNENNWDATIKIDIRFGLVK